MRRLIRIVGYLLVTVLLAGLAARVLIAASEGRPFYGRNVYGLAVGTYSTLAIFGIVASIGVIWLVQKVMKSRRR
ncbi:MAG: hypothetical protein ACOY5Y_09795 [Pseudomonadota bacterium]|jgi:uncharacterized membrane protein YqjE